MNLRSAAGGLSGFFFPMCCCLCGRAVSSADSGVCLSCKSSLNSFFLSSDISSSPVQSVRRNYYDLNFSLYSYDGPVRSLVSSLKKGDHAELGTLFGRDLALEFGRTVKADMITFIPVSPQRKRERGYNQAELIARAAGSSMGLPVISLLKAAASGNQKKMHYHERFLNMLGRFDPEQCCLDGKSVILVDDVFTTGATVNEASRVLKKMGAASVFSLTVARVDNKKVVIDAVSR